MFGYYPILHRLLCIGNVFKVYLILGFLFHAIVKIFLLGGYLGLSYKSDISISALAKDW